MKKLIILFVMIVLMGCQKEQIQEVKEDKQVVRCTFVGDMLYEKPYYDWIEDDSQDRGYYDLIKPYFQKDQLTIANLETPIGGEELGISGTGYSFNASQEIGKQIASLGIEVVSTANNHANDRGNKGIDNTLNFLNDHHMMAVGTYYNQEDREQGKYKTIDGIKFGFVSYTYATNQIVKENNRDKVGLFNEPTHREFTQEYKNILKKEVEKTRKNCDVLIAMMHWGSEFTYDINANQKEVAQFLSDLGVDIIIGNHPHCSQKIEWINDKTLCMYSLGNFVSADHKVKRASQEFKNAYNVSMMVTLDIVKDEELSIENISYSPVINYYNKELEQFQLSPFEDYDQEKEQSHYHYKNGLTKEWINQMYQELVPKTLANKTLSYHENRKK